MSDHDKAAVDAVIRTAEAIDWFTEFIVAVETKDIQLARVAASQLRRLGLDVRAMEPKEQRSNA